MYNQFNNQLDNTIWAATKFDGEGCSKAPNDIDEGAEVLTMYNQFNNHQLDNTIRSATKLAIFALIINLAFWGSLIAGTLYLVKHLFLS